MSEVQRNALTEMTAGIRSRVKANGIKARVGKFDNGDPHFRVWPIRNEVLFTEAEQRTILNIAKNNGLTFVRGLEIDVDQITFPNGMVFYMPTNRVADWIETQRKFTNDGFPRERIAS
jgi:hypothetical protein